MEKGFKDPTRARKLYEELIIVDHFYPLSILQLIYCKVLRKEKEILDKLNFLTYINF